MFKSLKLYPGASADFQQLNVTLTEFGYQRQETVSEEGDFSRRGEVLDIFPTSFELPIRISLENEIISTIKTFNPSTGEPLWEHKIVIILPFKKTHAVKTTTFSDEFPLANFVDLNIGDYVVHNQYGIGRFQGLTKIKVQDKLKDHLVIEYDRQEKLYVPVEAMHLVQKYIAFHIRRPRLHRLGTKEWQGIKDRTRKGIQKLAWDLLALQAMRMSAQGFAFAKDSDWQKGFEKTFPFNETPDQLKATTEVKADMESAKPMDRLL